MAERERTVETLGLTSLFAGAYSGRRVLVTGHTGFKGSWLSLWLRDMGAQVAGLALDPDTDPAHWNLLGLDLDQEFRLDLRDRSAIRAAVTSFQPQIVFHLAAQPLVRRSYRDPHSTFDTNVMGLVNLLDAVRACASIKVVVNATTDKVYEPYDAQDGYRESDHLGGHDPYSTSKACAELVSACYQRSYFVTAHDRGKVQLATARAGNVLGGGDWGEDRLVPDVARAANSGAVLHLRNPGATRPWQHVLEPLSGYLRLGQLLLDGHVEGGSWNLGPSSSANLTVGEVVDRLRIAWPNLQVVAGQGPYPHEAERLTLDSSKAARDLGWRSVWTAEKALNQTSSWYQAYYTTGRVTSRNDLAQYIQDAQRLRVAWAT